MNLYYVKAPTIGEQLSIVAIETEFLNAYLKQNEYAKRYPGKRVVITDARGQQYGLPLVVVQECE